MAIVRVEVPLFVMVAGLSVAVAPAGSPLTESATEPVNPPFAATVTGNAAFEPAATDWLDGDAETEKSVTFNVALVTCDRLPLVPVMVSGYPPTGVEPEVVMVNVDEPLPATEPGLNEAAAPAGRPATEKVTSPENPLAAETDVVKFAFAPARTL